MKVPSYFKPHIGMRVKKRFDETIYYGTITSGPFPVFNRKTQKEEDSWSILFDNEDEQDMNLEEISVIAWIEMKALTSLKQRLG